MMTNELVPISEEDPLKVTLDGSVAKLPDSVPCIQFEVVHASWRCIAYATFGIMLLFAKMCTNINVKPILAEGDNTTCMPFQDRPNGFDMDTDSHLIRFFGYNNMGIIWDYSPSRERTALIFPIVEYSFLIYIALNLIHSLILSRKGVVGHHYWLIAKVFFVIEFFLIAWSRMMFIFVAHRIIFLHATSFLGLLLLLSLIAIGDVLEILGTNEVCFGSLKATRIICTNYVTCNVIICALKIYIYVNVIFTGSSPNFIRREVLGNIMIGKIIDRIWLIFNYVIPFIASFIRVSKEKALMMNIDFPFQSSSSVKEELDGFKSK